MNKEMKKFILFSLFTLLIFHCYAQKEIYVSTLGNDQWTGESDKPFKSIKRALSEATDNIDSTLIYIAPGDYFIDETLYITKPFKSKIIIKGDKYNMPRFIGGIKINNWNKYKGNIYRTYIPEVKLYNFDFNQLYINGKRAINARTPNNDWYFVKDSKETIHVKGNGVSANYATQKIILNKDDMKSLYKLNKDEISNMHFRFYHKWNVTEKSPSYICPDSGYIFIQGAGMIPFNPITKDSRYIMYGYKSALDSPGEWYVDKSEGFLYYIPRENEDLSIAECIIPTINKWIIIKGNKAESISNIKFENISFQYSSYNIPKNGYEPRQAAADIEAAIEIEHSNHINFINCEMSHTGGYAIWFKSACNYNRIDHCFISDLGAGGIKIGITDYIINSELISKNNIVNNSIITHGGRIIPCGVGIAIFHSSDNKITHNEISDLYYTGVSVGWMWGYNNYKKELMKVLNEDNEIKLIQTEKVSPAVRNIISYNHIHHIGWGELSDMGAIYTLGESYGTRITNNIIHDVLSYDYGGWGLYTDEGSTDVEMSSNLVYRCKSGGFHQHFGKENKIENNIFAFGHYYQIKITRKEPHLSFKFKHNIILQDKGETLSGPWEDANIDMDYNLYWNLNDTLDMKGYSFKKWKKLKEKHSVMLNPFFIDPLNDNYLFSSFKNIKKIQFKPFDLNKVGIYGSKEWIDKAKISKESINKFRKLANIRLKK